MNAHIENLKKRIVSDMVAFDFELYIDQKRKVPLTIVKRGDEYKYVIGSVGYKTVRNADLLQEAMEQIKQSA